jgi:hypothetical protein
MNYANLSPTGNSGAIFTSNGVKILKSYKGVRGGLYFFDHCYFGSANFDVYNKDSKRIASNVNAY